VTAGVQRDGGEAAVGVPALRKHFQTAPGDGGVGEERMGAEKLHAIIADPEHAIALDAIFIKTLHAQPHRAATDGPRVIEERRRSI
jgi:3-deoxy-D-manno-octulosonic acid (KDO) 8-phosphate synthase